MQNLSEELATFALAADLDIDRTANMAILGELFFCVSGTFGFPDKILVEPAFACVFFAHVNFNCWGCATKQHESLGECIEMEYNKIHRNTTQLFTMDLAVEQCSKPNDHSYWQGAFASPFAKLSRHVLLSPGPL